jgi:hypothetical protein
VSFVGVPPSVVRAADMKKAKKGGRYAEPWVLVQEGRERQLAWPGPWKLRRPGGYRPGGFHIGNLILKKDPPKGVNRY